jgi:hypothetical protein
MFVPRIPYDYSLLLVYWGGYFEKNDGDILSDALYDGTGIILVVILGS